MSHEVPEDEFAQKFDVGLWKKVFRLALQYKRLLIPLAISAVSIAIVDASFALVTRWTIDDVEELSSIRDFWPHALAYLALAVALSVGVLVFIRCAGGLANHMSHDIRADCFKRLQELEFSYFDHRPLGWLISRLTSDCDKLSRIIAWGTLDLVWASCLVVIIAIILVVLNPVIGSAGSVGGAAAGFGECLFPEETSPEFARYAEIQFDDHGVLRRGSARPADE